MNYSGLCEIAGCSSLAEYLVWNENYCTYCESHKKSLTNSTHQVALLSLLQLDNVSKFIHLRRENNKKAVSSLFEAAKVEAGGQENKLINLQNWKRQVVNFGYKVYRSRYPQSLADGLITLVRLNYMKVELEGESALKPGEFREATFLQQKLNDEGLYISSKIESNDFKLMKILYFIPFHSFIVSAQIISLGNWRLLMKTLESDSADERSLLEKEVNHIFTRRNSAAYENLVCVHSSGNKYSYITENSVSEAFVNPNKTYKEEEVVNFLEFSSSIIQDSSNNSLNLNFLEPEMIGCFKGEFFLKDFKNPYSEYDRRYLAAEHSEVIRKDLSGLKFSAALIALQMLKVNIFGLNSRSGLPILNKNIDRLTVSQELKQSLKEALRNGQALPSVNQTENLTNNFTGLNLNK